MENFIFMCSVRSTEAVNYFRRKLHLRYLSGFECTSEIVLKKSGLKVSTL